MNSNYVKLVDTTDILSKYGTPVLKFLTDDQLADYGLNVFFCFATGSITPTDKLLELRQKYSGQKSIEQRLTIGGKKYAYRGEVVGFEALPPGDYLTVPELPTCPIAALVDNTLVMFWDLSRKLPANREAWRSALAWGLEKMDKEKYPPRPTESTVRAGVVKAFAESHRDNQRRLQSDYETHVRRSSDMLQQSIAEQKMATELIARSKSGEALAKALDQKVVEFLDYLGKNKKISEYFIDGQTMTIKTQNLKISHKDKSINLPVYEIVYDLRSATFTITCPELTGRTTRVHPHVFPDGRPCLGNYTTIYQKIISAGEYRQVIDLLLSFLETYNDRSPVTDFENFYLHLQELNKEAA